jgi:ABC-type multidrug transport system fused ATPase/permease subunit
MEKSYNSLFSPVFVTHLREKLKYTASMVCSGWNVMKWLLHEAYYKNKYGVVRVIISSGMALFFQVSVFVLSMMYIRALGHKEHVMKIMGYELLSTKDHRLTVCVIFYIIAALTMSALLHYYTQGKAAHVAQSFENKYLKVILKYLSKCSFENFNRLTWTDSPGTLERLLEADIKACGRIVRSLFLLLLPVTIVCFSICCLLYLSFELTLFLGLFVVVGFCIHLFLSHWSVKNVVLLE